MLHLFVFMGSFLLFTMEPMIARIILPNFGGAFHVWSITMTFFQGTLFLGYAYCHYVAKSIGKFHFIFVLLALIWIPLHTIFPTSSEISPGHLVLKLIVNYSIPFGVLATTSVIAQSWFSYQNKNRKSPYQLYVSSNAGSLLALISYITIFEPMIGLQSQKIIWFGGFLLYVILAWKCQNQIKEYNEQKTLNKNNKIDLKKAPIWLLLSALPSGFMLATTNAITLELGSMPLVWIIPLSIYLISFMLAFSNKSILPKRVLYFLLPSALLLGLCSLYTISLGYIWQLYAHIIALFFLSVIGHRELYLRRPEKENLTQFYLIISVGGWLGGIFVSFISPIVFNSLMEYSIIVAVFFVLLIFLKRKSLFKTLGSSPVHAVISIILLILIPIIVARYNSFKLSNKNVIYQKRNFYGIYRVTDRPLIHHVSVMGYTNFTSQLIKDGVDLNIITDEGTALDLAIKNRKSIIEDLLRKNGAKTSDELLTTNTKSQTYENLEQNLNLDKIPKFRSLMHGSTYHGEQIQYPKYQDIATSYYHANGPMGKIFKSNRPINVAIIGLGVGTCATYFNENDNVDFYELDEEVEKIAKEHFTFLKNNKAKNTKVITGDARIKIRNAENHIYDVIFVDAFSSDAIPSHLLTREALDLYQAKLAPGGTVVFHISNRHYELLNVIHSTGKNNWQIFAYQTLSLEPFQDFARFCALRRKEDTVSDLLNAEWVSMERLINSMKPWTDDYINTLAPLYEKYKNER